MRTPRKTRLLFIALLLSSGCETSMDTGGAAGQVLAQVPGPAGPEGPAGPQGPQGPQGARVTRIDSQDSPVAITGIVPTKVTCENGPINPGDLLTTSSTPGYAMRASPLTHGGAETHRTGTILGKAIEPLPNGVGLIRVLVMLR